MLNIEQRKQEVRDKVAHAMREARSVKEINFLAEVRAACLEAYSLIAENRVAKAAREHRAAKLLREAQQVLGCKVAVQPATRTFRDDNERRAHAAQVAQTIKDDEVSSWLKQEPTIGGR